MMFFLVTDDDDADADDVDDADNTDDADDDADELLSPSTSDINFALIPSIYDKICRFD